MSRLIDADALMEDCKDWDEYMRLLIYNASSETHTRNYVHDTENQIVGASEIVQLILEAPTIDAVEVVHGEWIGYNADKGSDWLRSDGEPIFLVCNKCHGMVMNNASLHWNFCPNCGAKMNGEREDE